MIWAWLTSKVAQLAALVTAALAVFAAVRRDGRKAEQADQKETDREKADAIRKRVDAARDPGVPVDPAADKRGYRD